ncbi:bcl2-associated agonist of cell death [Notechis scutatus]|uniref:Bcl2-associated agonist of cell death n=1 Tax=Notechis scutatus TaxID=8663 RepID=A0A6J1VYP8_9SAUR|nr:bcl2-associated agonist of cell death [Notechis scutatus]
MFQISEFQDETFSTSDKDPTDPKLSVWGPKDLNSPSHENPELRRRIGSDQLDSETSDEVGAFRARSRSAPPILWAAQRYGRELRRMSDEFHGALQKLPRPKSAGTCSHMDRPPPSWKDTLRSWWRRSCPENGPSGS